MEYKRHRKSQKEVFTFDLSYINYFEIYLVTDVIFECLKLRNISALLLIVTAKLFESYEIIQTIGSHHMMDIMKICSYKVFYYFFLVVACWRFETPVFLSLSLVVLEPTVVVGIYHARNPGSLWIAWPLELPGGCSQPWRIRPLQCNPQNCMGRMRMLGYIRLRYRKWR